MLEYGCEELHQYFDKTTAGGRRYIMGKLFYRCPGFFWVQTKWKTGGRNARSDANWVGPFECGKILNSFSDWNHRHKDGGQRKNAWDCRSCYTDWMGKQFGQYSVFLYTYEVILCLILDAPPDELMTKWRRQRVEFYKRVEPSMPCRDERPTVPRGMKLTQIQFTGEVSNRVWGVLLSDLDYAAWHSLEAKHEQDTASLRLDLLTELNTGARFHTVEGTTEGHDRSLRHGRRAR